MVISPGLRVLSQQQPSFQHCLSLECGLSFMCTGTFKKNASISYIFLFVFIFFLLFCGWLINDFCRYMPWHGKQLNDCCGRELDNTCSHDCVLKCKEDTEACPDKCHETCPGCNNPEPLSIRARDPNWNKGMYPPMLFLPILPSSSPWLSVASTFLESYCGTIISYPILHPFPLTSTPNYP